MVVKCVKVFVVMVFIVFNNVPLSPTFDALFFEKTSSYMTIIISTKNTIGIELFHVMMVGGLVSEVPFMSFTHFGFITT
jgi:hypothetical protein